MSSSTGLLHTVNSNSNTYTCAVTEQVFIGHIGADMSYEVVQLIKITSHHKLSEDTRLIPGKESRATQ